MKDPDNGDIRHVVDSIEQDQVECVDDGRAGEGDLASNNYYFFTAGIDNVKSSFALWGRVEWAGAELNGMDTWE